MLKKSSDVQVAFDLRKSANLIVEAFKRGNKLLICGNGGSAAMSQHMASELVWRLYKERQALPAIALTSDAAVLTAIANDVCFNSVFSRQIHAIGKAGDVLLGLSTSGKSPNVCNALADSLIMGIKTIKLNSCSVGSGLSTPYDVEFDFISTDTAKVQEAHLKIIHAMCYMIEREFD